MSWERWLVHSKRYNLPFRQLITLEVHCMAQCYYHSFQIGRQPTNPFIWFRWIKTPDKHLRLNCMPKVRRSKRQNKKSKKKKNKKIKTTTTTITPETHGMRECVLFSFYSALISKIYLTLEWKPMWCFLNKTGVDGVNVVTQNPTIGSRS